MIKHNFCAKATANLIWFIKKRIPMWLKWIFGWIVAISFITEISIHFASPTIRPISVSAFINMILHDGQLIYTHNALINFALTNAYILVVVLTFALILCAIALIIGFFMLMYSAGHRYHVNVRDALEQKRFASNK